MKKSFQGLLALQQGRASEVTAVEVEQIERVEEKFRRLAISQFAAQCLEIRKTGVAKNGRFPIDDGIANLEFERRFGDRGKLNAPVVATAGIHRYASVSEVDLRPVTIDLDLKNPAVAGWGALL